MNPFDMSGRIAIAIALPITAFAVFVTTVMIDSPLASVIHILAGH